MNKIIFRLFINCQFTFVKYDEISNCIQNFINIYCKIISQQLDIKLEPFTLEELDSVLRKNKNRKAAGLDEIPPEVRKTTQFDGTLLRNCNAVYHLKSPIDR